MLLVINCFWIFVASRAAFDIISILRRRTSSGGMVSGAVSGVVSGAETSISCGDDCLISPSSSTTLSGVGSGV